MKILLILVMLLLFSCTNDQYVSKKDFHDLQLQVEEVARLQYELTKVLNSQSVTLNATLSTMNSTDRLLFNKYEKVSNAILVIDDRLIDLAKSIN